MADYGGTLIEFPDGAMFSEDNETDFRAQGSVKPLGSPPSKREEPDVPRRDP